ERFVTRLAALGFVVRGAEGFADVALVRQTDGPGRPCRWLEVSLGPAGLLMAWLAGTEPGELALPEGGAASGHGTFISAAEVEECLEFVRTKDGVDVYRDKRTGKEYYTSRCQTEGPTAETLYREGADLIHPYLHLVGRQRQDATSAKGQRDLAAGI